MIDEDVLASIAAIAAGLDEPAREAEARQHYEAIVRALNGSTDAKGEQDALCVFEAVALTLGQLTADIPDQHARGIVQYVQVRCLQHRDAFAKAGKGARFVVEPDHA